MRKINLKSQLSLKKKASIIGLLFSVLFIVLQSHSIQGGDSGDLALASYTFGSAHPPGYPLYTFLGWLLTRIPVDTVAYRMGFLSSVPGGISLGLLYYLTASLTGSGLAAIIAVLFLAANRIFFYYSVTTEVFSLFVAFFSLTLLLCRNYLAKASKSALLSLAAVFGLSLGHHHLQVFAVPSVIYLMYILKNKTIKIVRSRFFIIPLLAFSLSGLFFYLYSYISGFTNPPMVWEDTTKLSGLYDLITRSAYGTFRSSSQIGSLPVHRLISVKTYFSLLADDINLLWLTVIVLGVAYMLRQKKQFALFLLINLFMFGPFYFFYASFIIASDFSIGLLERFLLPSYVILSVFSGYGIFALIALLKKYPLNFQENSRQLLAYGSAVILIIYAVVALSGTVRLHLPLRYDQTVEKFAEDLLSQTEENSILFLTNDTVLFSVQYARYVQNVRPDTAVFYARNLTYPWYRKSISLTFPKINFLPDTPPEEWDLGEFIKTNITNHPIYSNEPFSVPGLSKVPIGFLDRFYPEDSAPQYDTVKASNQVLWTSYSEPLAGYLSFYKHPLLQDVAMYYSTRTRAFTEEAIMRKDFAAATDLLINSIDATGDPGGFLGTELTRTYLFADNCDQAGKAIEAALSKRYSAHLELLRYRYAYYLKCTDDTAAIDAARIEYLSVKDLSEGALSE